MPTYVYECEYGHTFEVVQKMADEPLKRCTQQSGSDPGGFGIETPHPCESPCRRIIQAPGFILKGGGWFADGYSHSGKRKGE